MKAMVLRSVSRLSTTTNPLTLVDLPIPTPQRNEVLLRVSTCGVCHTELDEIEGRTMPPHLPVVPGHEVIAYVESCGPDVSRWQPGDRVGVGWIHHSSGGHDENVRVEFRATGRDVNGGYAEYMTVHEDYAYRIPDVFTDAQAAPLLCAGAIGYRALRLAQLENGQALGLTGFGGSAHLVLQLVQHVAPDSPVFVFARDESARRFAMELGAVWAGDTTERAPQKLDAIIDTTPAWKPVVEALANLCPGGRLVINAIRKEERDKDALLDLSYHKHLWMEREIKSVANITHYDIAEFLPLASEIPMQPEIETYPLDQANVALLSLYNEPVRGAKVLLVK